MHQTMTRIAQVMAILGALVLSFLIVMTCISVVGRELNSFLNSDMMQTIAPGLSGALLDMGIGPITGDFELIENAMAFAIFAFLPICQIQSAHASVDVFTQRLPQPVLDWMRAITEAVFAIVLIVFAFQLYAGMLGKMKYNETTYLIQFPVWWAYAAALFSATAAAIIATYMAGIRVYEAVSGQTIAQDAEGEV